MIWLLTALFPLAFGKGLMTKVGVCKNAPKDAATVMIVKQWHLAPKTITKGFKEKYPQEKNQSAIYIALADRIKNKKLDLVVAEGCEGEINDDFTTVFNGWDLATLKQQAQTKNFTRVVSHVPMKLEARFGEKILTVCGDDDKLIQEGLVRLSNLRGWAGFYSRLSELTSDTDRQKLFAESAAGVLKIDKDTPIPELVPKIKDKLVEELDGFNKTLTARNDRFVKTLQERTFKTAAVVIGGLHVEDLKNKVAEAGFQCEVLEPSGYAREDENLIRDFEKSIRAK